MGRLTLSVLLSFARFGRRGHRRADPGQDRRLEEKGALDGRGLAPLGCDPHPDPKRREPVVNGAEAETVRRLFGFHPDHGCLNAIADAARKAGSDRGDGSSSAAAGRAVPCSAAGRSIGS